MLPSSDSLVKSWEPNKITILLKLLELERAEKTMKEQVAKEKEVTKNQVLRLQVLLVVLTNFLTGSLTILYQNGQNFPMLSQVN